MKDYVLCFYCQEDAGEKITFPGALNCKRTYDFLKGYKTFAEDLFSHRDNNLLPENTNLDECGQEEEGILDFSIKNSIRWHKSCRMKVDKTRF